MRPNNFDLIRLLAALQVLIYHGLNHIPGLGEQFPILKKIVYAFPGVPIFFTISGFLIIQSYQRDPNLLSYIKKRALRIFPGLWVCFIFTFILLAISGYISLDMFKDSPVYLWIISQLTFFQFYKLPEFQNWGIGHPNGSLWSISVEIQFYLCVPIIGYFLFKKLNSKLQKNIFILIIGALSFFFIKNVNANFLVNEIMMKLAGVTIFNFMYYFCFGLFFYINWNKLRNYFINKAALWFIAYSLFFFLFNSTYGIFENVYEPTLLGFIGNFLLSGFTLAFAFTIPTISDKLIKKNDISYGIYIYHMPIINFAIYHNYVNNIYHFLFLILLICLIAILSWTLIEKKALKLKTL